MGNIVRLLAGFFFVSLGYDAWSSTMSPHWAGHDAWNLFGAGFFWSMLALWTYDIVMTARELWASLRARRATTLIPPQ